MEKVKIKTEFIKLDQFIKFVGDSYSGAEAKQFILDGSIKVNDQKEDRRGKKLRSGDKIQIFDNVYEIE